MKPQQTKRHIVDDQVIAALDVEKIVEPLWWNVNIYDGEAEYESGLVPFSLQQRYANAIHWYVFESYPPGRHRMFYSNPAGIVWEDALRGLEVIGAVEAADILRESADRLDGAPSNDKETRQAQIAQLEEDGGDFDDLDEQLSACTDAVYESLQKYIAANASAFYFDGYIGDLPDKI